MRLIRLFLLGLVILQTTSVRDQENTGSSGQGSYWTWAFHPSMNFNGKDFFLGLGLGMEELNRQWGWKLNFDMRPYFKKIQIREEDNSISQYFEKKFFLSGDLEKRFLKLNVGTKTLRFFAGFRAGMLFGNYRGLEKAPQINFGWAPLAGLSFDMAKLGYFKFGYCYLDTKNLQIPTNRIYIGFTFLVGGVQ